LSWLIDKRRQIRNYSPADTICNSFKPPYTSVPYCQRAMMIDTIVTTADRRSAASPEPGGKIIA
jgi:hypothetical protein